MTAAEMPGAGASLASNCMKPSSKRCGGRAGFAEGVCCCWCMMYAPDGADDTMGFCPSTTLLGFDFSRLSRVTNAVQKGGG